MESYSFTDLEKRNEQTYHRKVNNLKLEIEQLNRDLLEKDQDLSEAKSKYKREVNKYRFKVRKIKSVIELLNNDLLKKNQQLSAAKIEYKSAANKYEIKVRKIKSFIELLNNDLLEKDQDLSGAKIEYNSKVNELSPDIEVLNNALLKKNQQLSVAEIDYKIFYLLQKMKSSHIKEIEVANYFKASHCEMKYSVLNIPGMEGIHLFEIYHHYRRQSLIHETSLQGMYWDISTLIHPGGVLKEISYKIDMYNDVEHPLQYFSKKGLCGLEKFLIKRIDLERRI